MATITGVNPTAVTRYIWALIPAWQGTKGTLIAEPTIYTTPGRNPTGLVRASQSVVKRNLTGNVKQSTVRAPDFKGPA